MNTENHFIIGVDEVGRGPLLGDVVVCALVFDNALLMADEDSHSPDLDQASRVALIDNPLLQGLTDSKKLTQRKREQLSVQIKAHALAIQVAKVPASMIDQINILQATLLGMKQAIAGVMAQMLASYPNATFSVMVDGTKLPVLHDLPYAERIRYQKAIIRGDSQHACISAASVVAKVTRDNDMLALAELYPQYDIHKHKGYPTAAHKLAIKTYGILPMHRKSFAPIKQILLTQSS